MKHLIFISFLTLIFANSVLAETVSCINGVREDGITACDKCGDNCDWKIENGKLSISGSGNMYDYQYKEVNGWWHYVNSDDRNPWLGYNITSIDIDGVSNVGKGNFAFMTGVKSVNINPPVQTVSFDAFWGTHSLESVTLSDSVNSIGQGAFQSNSLKNIIIPDTVNSFGGDSFGRNGESLSNLQIICLGGKESCEKMKKRLQNYYYGGGKDGEWRKISLYNNISAANEQQCNSGNYYWNGVECVREPDISKRTCCPVCADLDGYCSRIRYTLPEADELTSNDNENMIEWIFE
ncbi:MAG: leucine-rich repeat domain-containing protein [Alphaproteobacteria bacterium]|nr:leucine-rich repeat domain-containing protein [Alphaproteobacteria bacterium]